MVTMILYGILSSILAAGIVRILEIRARYSALVKTSLTVARTGLNECLYALRNPASINIASNGKQAAIFKVPKELGLRAFPVYDPTQDVFWSWLRLWCPVLHSRMRGFGQWESKAHFQELHEILDREVHPAGYSPEWMDGIGCGIDGTLNMAHFLVGDCIRFIEGWNKQSTAYFENDETVMAETTPPVPKRWVADPTVTYKKEKDGLLKALQKHKNFIEREIHFLRSALIPFGDAPCCDSRAFVVKTVGWSWMPSREVAKFPTEAEAWAWIEGERSKHPSMVTDYSVDEV